MLLSISKETSYNAPYIVHVPVKYALVPACPGLL